MKIAPWDDVSQGTPDARRVFTVRSDRVRSRVTGREHTVDRLLAPDWVNAVAITEQETGYVGADARVIGAVLPNPAFMNDKATTIYIPKVTRVAEQQLDPMEELKLVKIPVEKVERMLKDGSELATALGMVALMWWQMAR